MANTSFSNLRVLQVMLKNQKSNEPGNEQGAEQTSVSFSVFYVDVEYTVTYMKDGVRQSKFVYQRLEYFKNGNVTQCDIHPGMRINVFADVDGYWFKDQQSDDQHPVNRLKITAWQRLD